MTSAVTIAKKEIHLLFKSKRRILLFFMVPIMLLVISAISVGIGFFISFTNSSDGPLPVTVIDHAQDNNSIYIIQNLASSFNIVNKSELSSPDSLLNQENPPDVIVYFPENFSILIQDANATARFYVWYDDKDLKNEVVIEVLSYYSRSLNNQVIVDEYGQLNLNRVNFTTQSTSTSGLGAEEASGIIIIPLYMLIFFVVPPTTLILISITQEREQKTLESLLLQPIKRRTIVMGKILYGLILVLSNLVVSLLAISVLLIFVIYLLTEYAKIDVLGIITPLITTEVIVMLLYLIIGLTLLSFLLISIAVFFSLIAKDEREGNMVISFLMIAPIFGLIIIYSIPIHTFDLVGQIVTTGIPIVGFLFAIYISLLQGSIGIPAITSLVFQLVFCLISVWFSAKIIEMEGILEIDLSRAFKKIIRR